MVVFHDIQSLYPYIRDSDLKDMEFIDEFSNSLDEIDEINDFFEFKDEWMTLLANVLERDEVNINLVKFLVEKGSDLNQKCTERGDFLLTFVNFTNFDLVDYLINKGLKLNVEIPIKFEENSTTTGNILHFISRGIYHPLVEYPILNFLVENGVDRNMRESKHGETPIIHYIKNCCFGDEWYDFHSKGKFSQPLLIFKTLITKENIEMTDNYGTSLMDLINDFSDEMCIKQELIEYITELSL